MLTADACRCRAGGQGRRSWRQKGLLLRRVLGSGALGVQTYDAPAGCLTSQPGNLGCEALGMAAMAAQTSALGVHIAVRRSLAAFKGLECLPRSELS